MTDEAKQRTDLLCSPLSSLALPIEETPTAMHECMQVKKKYRKQCWGSHLCEYNFYMYMYACRSIYTCSKQAMQGHMDTETTWYA